MQLRADDVHRHRAAESPTYQHVQYSSTNHLGVLPVKVTLTLWTRARPLNVRFLSPTPTITITIKIGTSGNEWRRVRVYRQSSNTMYYYMYSTVLWTHSPLPPTSKYQYCTIPTIFIRDRVLKYYIRSTAILYGEDRERQTDKGLPQWYCTAVVRYGTVRYCLSVCMQ